jgi:nitrite reductase/ring-hydroxylating ferredoxin subunit
MGEFLRLYWQPVGLSQEVTPGSKPKQVQVMGEDLVLFRDGDGRPGLLGLHCSHRLTSLAYGRVEDGGIRCPFHGWLYDTGGKCLEQPAEPEPFAERIQHLSYPCAELGGLIFAYLGPEDKKPLLPRYDVLVRSDGTRKVNYYLINSNYLQNLEGAVDTVHSSYLHRDDWSKVKHRVAELPKPKVDFVETDYGIWQRTFLPDANLGLVRVLYAHFFMPAGFVRIQDDTQLRENGHVQKHQSWYVPIDDTHTIRFQVGFANFNRHGDPYDWPEERDYEQPGRGNDYYRDYDRVDTICGIPVRTAASGVKGFLAQDSMVNETQGPIVDRSQEHLGVFDKPLAVMRWMYLVALADIKKGKDPKHIIRDPAVNEVVSIRGNDESERA